MEYYKCSLENVFQEYLQVRNYAQVKTKVDSSILRGVFVELLLAPMYLLGYFDKSIVRCSFR